jgi:hypothetical protein
LGRPYIVSIRREPAIQMKQPRGKPRGIKTKTTAKACAPRGGEFDPERLKRWIGGLRCAIEIALSDVVRMVVARQLPAVMAFECFGELVEELDEPGSRIVG